MLTGDWSAGLGRLHKEGIYLYVFEVNGTVRVDPSPRRHSQSVFLRYDVVNLAAVH